MRRDLRWLTNHFKKGAGRRSVTEKRSSSRKEGFKLEQLEPRVLLNADTLIGGVTGAVQNGLVSTGNTLLGVIATDSQFDTPIPGVLQTNHDVAGATNDDNAPNGKLDDKDLHVPDVRDVLSLNVNRDNSLDGNLFETIDALDPFSQILGGINTSSLADVYRYVSGQKPMIVGTYNPSTEQALNAMWQNAGSPAGHVVDFRELYRVLVVGAISDYLENYNTLLKTAGDLESDFAGFLNNLSEPSSLNGVIDLDLTGVSNKSDSTHFGFAFTVNLKVKDQFLIDLGQNADKNEIIFPEKVYTPGTPDDPNTSNNELVNPDLVAVPAGTRTVELDGSISLPFSFTLDISPASNFQFAVPNAIGVAVNDNVAGSGGETLNGLIADVGFLGTEVPGPNNASKFNLHMGWTISVTDPSSPSNLGFTILPTGPAVGTLTANTALPNDPGTPYVFPQDVFFDLTIGSHATSSKTTVTVTKGSTNDNTTATNLKDDLQTALDAAFHGGVPGGIVTAGLDGTNHLTLTLPTTDITPLGYASNELFDNIIPIQLNATNAPSILGHTSSDTIKFLMSLAGGIPKLVTIVTTPGDDDPDGIPMTGDEGQLSIAGLVNDIQNALNAAGLAGVSAVNNGGKVQLSHPLSSLEVTRTLKLDAQFAITTTEFNDPSFPEFMKASKDAGAALNIVMPLNVRQGLDFGPTGNPGIRVDLDPFTLSNSDLTPDPSNVKRLTLALKDSGGVTLIDQMGSDFLQYLDFNVVGPGEAIGMIQQLENWLTKLSDTDMLGKYTIPFAQAVFGQLLSFDDMIHDTLLFDDMDSDKIADVGKLLASIPSIDPKAFVTSFGTAQELGARLDKLFKTSILVKPSSNFDGQNDPNSDFAAYDKANQQLLYQLNLSHVLEADNVAADYSANIDLTPDVISDISTQSKIHLQATGHFEAILGMQLGPGRIQNDTLLADLNGGLGAGIATGIALTGAGDVSVIRGRLSADAHFKVGVNNDPLVEVRVYKSAGPAPFAPVVDTIGDKITVTGHGLHTGDLVIYSNGGGTSIGGLNSGDPYYVIKIDENTIQLATSAANALASTPVFIDLTGAGAGASHTLLHPNNTDTNLSDAELLSDINSALTTAGLNTKIQAIEVLNRIVLQAVDASVAHFTVNTSPTDTSYTELGLASTAATTVLLQVVPPSVKVSSDVTLNIELNNDGTVFPLVLHSGLLGATATGGNITLTDLANDINEGLAAITELNGKIVATRSSNNLLLVAVDSSVKSFRVSAASGPASEIGFGTPQVAGVTLIAPNDVGTSNNPINLFGKLSADAHFSVVLNADAPISVTVTKSATDNNTSLDNDPNAINADELIDDINTAINGTLLSGKIKAERVGNFRIAFRAIDASVLSFQITAAGGDPAVTELGLATSQTANGPLRIMAIRDVPFFFGPSSDATFTVTVVGGTSAVMNLPVTVKTSETLTDLTIQDFAGDLRRALDAAFGSVAANPLLVSNDGNRILLKPKSTGSGVGVTSFSITVAKTNTAFTDLKLYQPYANLAGPNVTSTADKADLLIYTQDGLVHPVTLDDDMPMMGDDTTVGQVLADINAIAGSPVTASINTSGSGINLVDHTSGSSLFRVDSVNGSHAPQALGIFGADTDVNNPIRDGKIFGTRIATLQLGDRAFLRQVNPSTPILSADFVVGAATFQADGFGVVDLGANTIKITENKFTTGDAVVYRNGGGTSIGNLTDGTTYYVIVVNPDDPNTIKLATSKDNAIANMAVDLTGAGTGTQRLESLLSLEANFGFVGVTMDGSGTLSGKFSLGLLDTSSTAKVQISHLLDALSKDQNPKDGDVDVFDLATLVSYPTVSPAGVNFGTLSFVTDLQDGLPSGTVNVNPGAAIKFTLDNFGNPFAGTKDLTFPSANVAVGTDAINITAHGLTDGMEVVYTHGTDGTDVGGLLNGSHYFVIVVDADHIQLAATAGGTAIDLTNQGGGTGHRLQGFVPIPAHATVDYGDSNLQDLVNFTEIHFDNVITALQGLSQFLTQFAALPFLSAEIPLIGKSFNDLVDLAPRFATAVTEIVKDQAPTVQKVEQKIRETFGLPSSSSVFGLSLVDNGDMDSNTTDMLKVKLNLSKALSKALNIDLDLGDQLPGISIMGAAGLNITGMLSALLTFGVDLDDPSQIYLFTEHTQTGISASLSAQANNLTFHAALGPVGIFITGGDVNFSLTGGFQKSGGSVSDKILLTAVLADPFAAGFNPSFNGSLKATLPVFFPTESTFKGDVKFSATLSVAAPDYDLNLVTDLEVPPDILNVDFSQFSLFDSVILAVDTFDAFLGSVQDLLDGEIFGVKLPLIGDKLSEGAEFISDIRKNVIQPFRDLVETAKEKGPELIQGFLFDLLGPGNGPGDPGPDVPGLGLLLDPTDLDGAGNPTKADSSDRSHINDIIKITKNLTGPIDTNFAQWNFLLGQVYTPPLDFDFDLGFPGLSLALDGGLIFSLGWQLNLGLGISIKDGPYIEITSTDSTDDPLSHAFPNSPDGEKNTFENISPNTSDMDKAGIPNGASGGRINGLATDPTSNMIFYAASEFGGIYKSEDGGDTWKHLDNHMPQVTWDVEVDPGNHSRVYATSFFDGRVNSIAGINVSTDGGDTWTHPVSSVPDGGGDNTPQAEWSVDAARVAQPSAFGISIRPDHPQDVVIGTNTGVAISHDSGQTWQFFDPTTWDPAGDVYDVLYQKATVAHPNGIIDVVGPFGQARSTDGGMHWQVNTLPGPTFNGVSIAASPDDPNVLFVVGVDDNARNSELYESDDEGLNWNALGNSALANNRQGRIPFVTVNDRTGNAFDVWFGDVDLYRIPADSSSVGLKAKLQSSGLWKKSDEGAHDDVGDIVFDSQMSVEGIAKLHSNDGGVYRNTAKTVNDDPIWEQPTITPHGLYIMGFQGVDQPGNDHEDIYFAVQDDGVWALTQAGASNAADLWHAARSADGFDVAADNDQVLFDNGFYKPGRGERLFLGGEALDGFNVTAELGKYPSGAVINFKHSESFETWGDDKFAILTADSNGFNDNSFGTGGLFITTNIKAGASIVWTPVMTGTIVGGEPAPDTAKFADLQVALDNSGNPTFYITVGDGNGNTADQLWKVTGVMADGSGAATATWERIDKHISNASGVSLFAADRTDPMRLYAAAVMNSGQPAMWHSEDGGATWNPDTTLDGFMTNPDQTGGDDFLYKNDHGPSDFPFPLTGFATQGLKGYLQPTLLAFDSEDPNLIVAGGADSGVFLSKDKGAHWELITDPLGTDPKLPHIPRPRFAYFDHEGTVVTLYIASQGSGIWRVKLGLPVDTTITGLPDPTGNDKGSAETLTGSEPTLDNYTINSDTDLDFFKYTPDFTGNTIINLYFDNLFGDLNVEVQDSGGTTIAKGQQTNLKDHLDLERIIFPVVDGDHYYIKVSGQNGATGYYDMVLQRSRPELDLFIEAGIETGSTLTGKLAFLQLDVNAVDTNFIGNTDADPTGIRADFTVDIFNGDDPADNRLSLFELGSLSAAIGVTAEAKVNFDLKLGLNEDLLPDTIAAAIPKVEAQFHLDWSVGGPIQSIGLDNLANGLKLMEFTNVGIDLGSFLSDTVGPIVAKIQEITEPLQPIIDIVTARIPVLSDLAGRTITLADIAAAFGEFDPDLIYAVADIVSLVNSINTGGGQSLFLKLGDFKLVDVDHPDQALFGGDGSNLTNPNFHLDGMSDSQLASKLGDMRSAGGQSALDDLTDPSNLDSFLGADSGAPAATTTKSMFSGGFSSTPDKSGFAFPIFKSPSQIFGLLLGKNATFITYDLPPFLIDFKWEVSFPIYPPLYGLVTAGVGVKIDLAFGYDTQGIKDFADGGFQNPLDLLSGFYVSDTNMPDGSFGVDVPELVFTGTIGVGAELNAGIASAGVNADITLTANFDLYDPNHDGKVRISELVSTFLFEARNGSPALAPLAIFDIFGDISLKLSAFIEILTFKLDFDITPKIVLFEFKIPFEREPILATERGDGSVLLNIGPNAMARENGDTRDIAETIHVKDGGSGKVAVWSDEFGVPESAAQLYSIGAGKQVVAFGGEGDDWIDATGLTTNPVMFDGGSGNDTLKGGKGNDILKGDIGSDHIFGSEGDDTITGGQGDDEIDGGPDADIIFGDTGTVNKSGAIRSSIGAKDGNDTITGGTGKDIIFGDGGDDVIGGDVAASLLDGAGDDDFIFGDGASIEAQMNNPKPDLTMVTNADGTVSFPKISLTDHKGGGKDTIRGHGGKDVIFGGSGDDDLDGGAQDDIIFGESGLDLISGGGQADTIMGGSEDDRIFGFRDELYVGDPSDGNDVIFGGTGNDFIRGNGGDDIIHGNTGADVIFGDYGNDNITGDTDPDLIFGGPGRDFIDGGTGNDIIFGDDGFVVWVNFFDPDIEDMIDTPNDHRAIGLIGGDADVFDNTFNPAITDAQLDLLDPNIRADADDNVKSLDLIKTLVNAATDGNDTITGGEGDDIVLGGADTLFNGVKGDTIYGDFNPSVPLTGPVPAGADILIGDGGRIQFDDRRRENVRTIPGTSAGEVGNDTISGNGGDDLIFGGGANDTLYGRMSSSFTDPSLNEKASVTDNDVIIGDDGEIQYETLGAPQQDAGPFDPSLEEEEVGPPTQTFVGARAVFVFIKTDRDALFGGIDHAYGNKGDDIIFGGIAGDVLKGDDGADGDDIILGDNGQIDFGLDDDGISTKIEQIYTTDIVETTGGPDTIEGQDGNDIIFGGVNNGGVDLLYGDRATPIDTSDAQDIILGDDGRIRFDVDPDLDTLDKIESFLDGLGGSDVLSGDRGDDVLIGSTGGDTMYGDDANASSGSNDGEDIMLGDNGDVVLIGTVGRLIVRGVAVDLITTTDISESTGGADTMSGNAKADIMLGGVNNGGVDTMYGDRALPNATTIANDGDDVLLGDDGLLDFTYLADTDRNTLDLIHSFMDGLGGSDTISGNKGQDVAIGGTGGDTMYGDDAAASAAAADQADLLLGDNADVFLVAKGQASGGDLKLILGSAVKTIRTTDDQGHPEYGGSDTISGNAKGDIIAGGVKGDTLYGDRQSTTLTTATNDGDDIILGDNGAFEWLSTGRLGEIHGIDINANNPALYAKFNSGTPDADLTTLDLITTEQPTSGGRDTIYGDEKNDLVFGGTDLDIIHGDDGDEVVKVAGALNRDVLFGDHGRIYPHNSTLADFNSRNFFAIDTGNLDGGEGDKMWGEEGDDVMLGQQGDDRMWGGSGNDDMIGGHNVSGGYDELGLPAVQATLDLSPSVNDLMDGGTGNDAMTGDNAIVWRRGDDLSPRFRSLTQATIYTTTGDGVPPAITTNVGAASQSDPDDAVGRDIQLVDHDDNVQASPMGRFGSDVMAGGADNDVLFGELGDDLIQGDGSIVSAPVAAPVISRTLNVTDSGTNPDTDETLYFNVPEAAGDGDDYIEGNGGSDLIYGGLGQDDIIGGSSELFGLDGIHAALLALTAEQMRPDSSDIIFGGSGTAARIARNDFVGSSDYAVGDANGGGVPTNDDPMIQVKDRHSRDADFIMGDNADVFRIVNPATDSFREFNYDQTSSYEDRGNERIVVRGMKQLDYTLGGADFAGGSYTNGAANLDNGAADIIHGESGDDYIFGMTGSDVIFGESDDDDIVGGYGNDWISGGTGRDGILGDDGLVLTSRNNDTVGEPLYGIAPLLSSDPTTKYSNGNALDETIATPGDIQIAVINSKGALKKTVDIVPFSYDPNWLGLDDEYPDNDNNTPFADDIIFGGLNSDWLHGGSGDDAISGAEALPDAYVPTFDNNGNATGKLNLGYSAFTLPNPTNPGNSVASLNPGDVLAFNTLDLNGQHLNNRFRAGEFFLYDEYDPLRKILLDGTGNLWKSSAQGTAYEFLLNFNKNEGVYRPGGTVPKATGQQTTTYDAVNDDGTDAIFGDMANDWLVGGTGRDDIYGGWGNDLINADDNQTTDSDLNDMPDTHPTYEDRAYGGAGRDVLIANTGGDRLIDWVGEYNSYLVPFAPFGEATVSRTLQPFLPEYLYALSAGDGADATRYVDFFGAQPPAPTNNNPNPSRNGEPHAEMGLVLQQDFAWQDQTGAPSDPQAGNIPGGPRDVLRTASFNDGTADAFFVDSGTWAVTNGAYQVAPATLGQDAVSVFFVNQYIPSYFEVLSTLNAVKPTAGFKSNAYVIFDYQTPTDFKFAGINVSTNKLEVGHRDASGWIVDKQSAVQASLRSDTDYNVFLSFNGSAVTMIVDNTYTLTYTYAPRIDFFGISHGLHDGMVGLGANNSKAKIDNVIVQKLQPALTLSKTVDFSSGSTSLFDAPLSGSWSLGGGRYAGTADGSTPAIDTVSFNVQVSSIIDLSATFKVTGEGGLVYDQYDVNDFKFVTISAGKITLGHRTPRGWFADAVINNASIVAGTDYTLGVTLKGTTVSVTLNGSLVASRTYNAVVTDGNFGLLSRTGTTSFDTVTVKSDDPRLLNAAFALTAEPAALDASTPVVAITDSQIASIANAAIQQWSSTLDAEQQAAMKNLQFTVVTDLPGDAVAWNIGDGITLIDMNAAGRGWFIDPTPMDSREFRNDGSTLVARNNSAADGRMDLLSTLIHEIGHALGYEHTTDGPMDAFLAAGERRQLINWDDRSMDLRAALGWNSTSFTQNPAFPEFSLTTSGHAPKKRVLDDISADAELQPIGETDWYVEI